MQYDPIKRETGKIFNCCKSARLLFYSLLNILLLRSWYVRKEVRNWARYAPAGAAILDAGSGFGQYIHFISRLNKDYTIKGIDVKDEEIENCRRFFVDNQKIIFEKADLNTFVEQEKFDLILCIDVLEHIADDVGVMKNLCASMKKGGLLLISTPSDRAGSEVHGKDGDSFIEEHVRDGYPVEEIESKLRQAGFSRTETIYSYGRPGQLSWKLSMKYPISMLNRGRAFYLVLPVYYMITLPFAMLLNFRDLRKKHNSGTGLIVKAVK